MNFKTTIILILLLAGVGTYIYFTHDKNADDDTPKKVEQRRLVDLKSADVTKISIVNDTGTQTLLEKTDTGWRITKPLEAAADPNLIGNLLSGILGLTSTAEVESSGPNAPRTGLDKPQIVVELTTGSGTEAKQTKLIIGDKLAVSHNMYVRVEGHAKAQVVSADLLEKLDRPARQLRQMQLVTDSSDAIQQVTIAQADSTIQLQKSGEAWEMVQPMKAAADPSAMNSLLGAITLLRATEFVDEPSDATGLEHPQLTLFFSTRAPATQPSTQPATAQAGVTIAIGGYDDVLKKNIYVRLSDSTSIAKVPASVLESFGKKPLELRDKNVVRLNPAEVKRFSILTEVSATSQPTSRPAQHKSVQIERRKEGSRRLLPMVPPPTVQPTTAPATTRPANLAAFKPKWPWVQSPWVFTGGDELDADISDVNAFLDVMNPLQAEKYLEKLPPVQPAVTYTVQATTIAAGGRTTQHEIRFVDPGGDQPLVGEYNGLQFEVPRMTALYLEKSFKSMPGSPNRRPEINLP